MTYLRSSLAGAVMLALFASAVQAAPIGYSYDDANDTFYKIDFGGGGTVTAIGGPTLFSDIEGLTYLNGTIYGVDDALDTLVSINETTGAVTAVRAGVPSFDSGLTHYQNTLIMSNQFVGGTMFFAVDPAPAGSTTLLVPDISVPSIDGLANHNGTLYGVSGATDELYKIMVDLGAGSVTATKVADLTAPGGAPVDLIDEVGLASDGQFLYSVDDGGEGAGPGFAFRINPNNGVSEKLFEFPNQFEGLAMKPNPIPEPSAIASLIALSGMGFVVWRRRRRAAA